METNSTTAANSSIHECGQSSNDVANFSTTQKTRLKTFDNSLLIWFDPNIDQSNDTFHNATAKLKSSVSVIKIFTDIDRCVDFLTDITHEIVFMIVSNIIDENILRLIHDIPSLNAIFVLVENKLKHAEWSKDWLKVKGIYIGIDSLCESITQSIQHCDQNAVSISFFSDDDVANKNLDQLDQSFMYTQILKEILFEIDFNEESFENFVGYCYEKIR